MNRSNTVFLMLHVKQEVYFLAQLKPTFCLTMLFYLRLFGFSGKSFELSFMKWLCLQIKINFILIYQLFPKTNKNKTIHLAIALFFYYFA